MKISPTCQRPLYKLVAWLIFVLKLSYFQSWAAAFGPLMSPVFKLSFGKTWSSSWHTFEFGLSPSRLHGWGGGWDSQPTTWKEVSSYSRQERGFVVSRHETSFCHAALQDGKLEGPQTPFLSLYSLSYIFLYFQTLWQSLAQNLLVKSPIPFQGPLKGQEWQI